MALPQKDGKDALLDLINANASVVFSFTTISLSVPVASSAEPGTNTKVTVTALPNTAFGGSIDLFYNRDTLTSAFSKTALLFTIPSASTIHNLITQINTSYGTFFTTDDLNDGSVAANATSIALVAASTSYVFQPGTTVTLAKTNAIILMHFDGANGSTSLVDVAGNPISVAGGPVISTSQSKFGGSSLWYPTTATRGSVSIPDVPAQRLTGPFTIEFFLYASSSAPPEGQQVLVSKSLGNNGCTISTLFSSWYVQNDSSTVVVSGGTLTLNTWLHVALVCGTNGTWTLYVNGVSVGSRTLSGSFGNNTDPWTIGNTNINGNVPLYNGFIDELRVSTIARYTGNFTPPSAPFANLN